LGRLCQALLPSDTIQEIKYFTARVSARPSNPTSAHDQGFVHSSAANTSESDDQIWFISLHTRCRCIWQQSLPLKRVWGRENRREGIGLSTSHRISFEMLSANNSRVAVLINERFRPRRAGTDRFSRTANARSEFLNPHQHHSKELQRYATFVKRIRQGHLLASQFPHNSSRR